MITRHHRGTTAQNNALTLANGQLSIDLEKMAVRLHDGLTPGGFEVLGTQAYDPPVPGPDTLIGGDTTAGFYGEVATTDLVDQVTLSDHLGISQGVINHPDEPWLKFALDGKTLYVAKKAVRSDISWRAVYLAGAVYGDDTEGVVPSGTPTVQDARITLNGIIYRVRLMQGLTDDPTLWDSANLAMGITNPSNAPGSEWDRLILPIMDGTWASYTTTDLYMANGGHTWTKESSVDDSTLRVLRGVGAGNNAYMRDVTTPLFRGWRPVLELMS